jgi:methionine-rich copper-binding protein CopC
MLQRIARLTALALAVVAAFLLVTDSLGTAHPSLVANQASPGPGDLLSASPSQVKLIFNVEPQGLVPEQSFFWVFNVKGLTVVALGKVDLSAADRNVMVATLPQLSPGVYEVFWVAVSLADQGFSQGSYTFAVTGQ